MKLGSLIPEVKILCVKLQDSRKIVLFCFRSMHFPYENTTPHFKILKCDFWFPPYKFRIFCYPPNLIRNVRKNRPPPPSARGDEGMIEGVRGTSIGVVRVVAYV